MGSEVKVTSSSNKDEGGKACFRLSAFMIDYIAAYKSQMAFMGIRF